MISLRRISLSCRHFRLLLVLLLCALPFAAGAKQENRLQRIQVIPHKTSTRINLFFQDPPDYTLSVVPARIRLTIRDADAPLFRRLRAYSDPRVKGVFCSQRYRGVSVTIPVQQGAVVQEVASGNPAVLSFVVGSSGRAPQPEIVAGREAILNGTEKLVREFDAPARAGLPFAPTDAEFLKRILPEPDVKLFQRAEGLIYRQQGKEAAEILATFLNRAPAVQALASYRLGEAFALMQKDKEALEAFRRGEALWPAYLEFAPEILQVYAELRARNGDFAGGRDLISRLAGRLSGTMYAPQLLNRLANLYERHGDTALALEMYRTVAAHAPGSEAATRARMKIADSEMFTVPKDRYLELLERYRAIYDGPGDLAVRDEALFKMALLHALYGPAQGALEASISYDTRYPHGIFSTIVKKMREELLVPVYREIYAAKDPAALAKLALGNREYLTRCLSDADFAPRLTRAFHDAGMLTQELDLFGYLAERSWAAASAPYLCARMVEDALTLGNAAVAEAAGRAYLARFPAGGETQRVREELGRIAYEKGDLKGAAAELSFLGGKGKKALFPESDYYLGKALAAAGDERGAEKSLARFTSAAPSGSPLMPDGLFALAGARVALKQYPAALAAYRQGAQLSTGETADQFLYKMGELYLKLNMVEQAREAWEKVAGRGGGGTWVKLASESLSDLKWRLKIAGQLP